MTKETLTFRECMALTYLVATLGILRYAYGQMIKRPEAFFFPQELQFLDWLTR